MAHSNFFGLQESYETGTRSYTQASFSSDSATKILLERASSQNLASITAYVKARIQTINGGTIHSTAEKQVLAYLGLTSIGPQMDFAPPREEIHRRVLALDSSADSIQALLTLTQGKALPGQESSIETGGDASPAAGSSAPIVAQGNGGADASGHDGDDPSGDDRPITDEDAPVDGDGNFPPPPLPEPPAPNTFFGHQVGGQTVTLDQAETCVRQAGATTTAAELKQYVEGRVDLLADADSTITEEHKTKLKTAMLEKMGLTDLTSSDDHTAEVRNVDFVTALNAQASNFRALYAHVKAQAGVSLDDLPPAPASVSTEEPVPVPVPQSFESFWGNSLEGARRAMILENVSQAFTSSDENTRRTLQSELKLYVDSQVKALLGDQDERATVLSGVILTKLGYDESNLGKQVTDRVEAQAFAEQLDKVKNASGLSNLVEPIWALRGDNATRFTADQAVSVLQSSDSTQRTALKTFVESRVDALMDGHGVSEFNRERTKNAVLHQLGFAVETTTDRVLIEQDAVLAFQTIGKLTTPQAMGAFAVANLAPLDKLAKDVANTSSNSDKWEFVQAFLADKMVEKRAASSTEAAKAQTEALKPYFMTSVLGRFRPDAQKDLRIIVKNFVDNIPANASTPLASSAFDATNWYQRMQLANQAQIKGGMSAQQCADYCETVAVLTLGGDEKKLRGHLEAIKSKHDGGYAELALTGLDSAQPAQVLDVIKSRFKRDADRQEKAQHDEKRRLKLIAEGKYRNQESGWGYCDSAEEAGELAITLKSKSQLLEDFLVVSATHKNDLLRLDRAFDNVTWTAHEIDNESISVPGEDTACKSVQAYMAYAKQELSEAKWTVANQQAVYAYAMARIAEANPTFAQSCMDVQDAYPGKQWVLTPSARKAMGLAADFSLETARQQAFNIMHENVDCRFVRDLKSYKVPSQPDTAAGLAPAPPDPTLEKLRKHPQLQEAFWREYWARVYKKPSYALDEQGRPKVGANLDGSTVLHYGKGAFAKVNHNGCSKSNGIHSQLEADNLVAAMRHKRILDGKSEIPTHPLMAYGKNANAIKYLLIACHKNGVPVRIDPNNPVAKKALQQCSSDVQGWVHGHVAYRDLRSQASSGTGGKPSATPMHEVAKNPHATPPEPQPGTA